MPRAVFASSCRSVPSQVPGLVENQTQAWRSEKPTLGGEVLGNMDNGQNKQ